MSLRKNIDYSIWCDFIERDFLEGEFQDIISDKIFFNSQYLIQQNILNK